MSNGCTLLNLVNNGRFLSTFTYCFSIYYIVEQQAYSDTGPVYALDSLTRTSSEESCVQVIFVLLVYTKLQLIP